MDDELTTLTVLRPLRDEGTIWLFEGTDGELVFTFAVEHRYAGDLLAALESGEEPEVAVPDWSFWGGSRPFTPEEVS